MTFCLYDKKKRIKKSSLKVIHRMHLWEYVMNEARIIVWPLPELILYVFCDTNHLLWKERSNLFSGHHVYVF